MYVMIVTHECTRVYPNINMSAKNYSVHVCTAGLYAFGRIGFLIIDKNRL